MQNEYNAIGNRFLTKNRAQLIIKPKSVTNSHVISGNETDVARLFNVDVTNQSKLSI